MTLDQVVRDARIIITVGAGGVGKTTTAAVIAMHAARAGRRALVLTIDPARRLANSLGLDGIDHALRQIPLEGAAPGGELWASMLDMKSTFDAIVARYAPDATTRERILANRFYHYFSTSLAGAQELSASERLFEVVQSGQFDLVVLDTPPAANALDFLDAPVRFFDALDSAAIQWVISATGFGKSRSLFGLSTQLVLSTLGRFTGRQFFEELGEFLHHFSGLLDGIRERSEATQRLLRQGTTRLVLVASPDGATIDQAFGFRDRLAGFGVDVGAVVVNRTHRALRTNRFVAAPIGELVDALEAIEGARVQGRPTLTRLARLVLANAAQWTALADRDDATLARLRAELPGVDVIAVPTYAADIHSLDALDRMRADLFG
ncbi:MAG: ArsA family ATPase [Myxococcales bacterium]|nr:ArsA family ATPase [Myxococcales bacterium]